MIFRQIKNYPLLNKLILQQLFLAFLGVLLVLGTLYELSYSRNKSALFETKQKVIADLRQKQEQLRVWKQFNLVEAIERSIEDAKQRLPISWIAVVPREELPQTVDAYFFQIPEETDSDLDFYVIGKISEDALPKTHFSIGFFTIIILICSAVFFTVLFSSSRFILNQIYAPLRKILEALSKFRDSKTKLSASIAATGEMRVFINEIESIHAENLSLLKQQEELQKNYSLAELAAQVAHDIRSPLTALNVLSSNLSLLPEDLRVMTRGAINRIQDISNTLLEKHKELSDQGKRSSNTESKQTASTNTNNNSDQLCTVLLASIIDELITEKRLQYRSKIGIDIGFTMTKENYGLFAKIQPCEFKRVLSNLINNAVEAVVETGQVHIEISLGCPESSGPQQILVKVKDNGCGIPENLLAELGERGVSFGKLNGSGLGLFHAKTTLKTWGGNLRIESSKGKGTSVILSLPKADAPSWFVEEIQITPNSIISILDDESSIHFVWDDRFLQWKKMFKIQLQHFTNPNDFTHWIKKNASFLPYTLFLVDFELMGFSESGLDLIERLGIQAQSILVTSKYEEVAIRMKCEELKVRLIPKGMAGYVPIKPASILNLISEDSCTPLVEGNGNFIDSVGAASVEG